MSTKLKLWFFIIVFFQGITYFFHSTPLAQTLIPCGEATSGSISAVGEKDSFTFTAGANNAVTIRVVKTSGEMTPYLELYDPANYRVGYGGNSSDKSVRLDRTLYTGGVYTIKVSDYNNDQTGDYKLVWQRLNNPCNATPINCGAVLTGDISDPTAFRFYTFTAAANDAVTIRIQRTAGEMTPWLELYDATGYRAGAGGDATGTYVRLDRTLYAGGVYTLVVSDYNLNLTGSYNLLWQRLNNPCQATPIDCGSVLTGDIGDPTEFRFYTFTAAANDAVTVRIQRTAGEMTPWLELYDATGYRAGTGGDATATYVRLDRTLYAGGVYTLVVSDYNRSRTGSYTLVWQRLNNPCNAAPVTCGTVTTGDIGDPTGFRFYTFTAAANDAVTIRIQRMAGEMTPWLELYDATGYRAGTGGDATAAYVRLDRTLSAGGVYTLVVSDYNRSRTGSYNLLWQRLNDPCNATSLICGETASSSLGATGEQDFYTITGEKDDVIVLTLTRTSGSFVPYLELYDGKGFRVANQSAGSGSSASITQTLFDSGAYVVIASDYSNNRSGDYNLEFRKKDKPCSEVGVIAPNGGEVFEAGSTLNINWKASIARGIVSQEIRLSTDGGANYPTVIAGSLPGTIKSFVWSIPGSVSAVKCRVRVTVTDPVGAGISDVSDADFIILQNVAKSTLAYSYDDLNRLTEVTDTAGGRVRYSYDANGNRVALSAALSGDVNGDGRVDVVDLLSVLLVLSGKLQPGQTPCRFPEMGDLNHSGQLDQEDFQALSAIIVGARSLGRSAPELQRD